MNKIVLCILLLFSMIILSCQTISKESVSQVTLDCGTDTICFSNNFKTCTPSKIYGGAMEIKSGTSKSCKIYAESLDDPKYTGGERLKMDCIVTNTDTFKDSEMNGLSIVQKGSSCSGTLYEFYAKLIKT